MNKTVEVLRFPTLPPLPIFSRSPPIIFFEEDKKERDVSELIAELKNRLLCADGLMFKGEALTDKELKQLSDAIEVSAAVVLSQKRGKAMKKLKPSPKGFTKKYGSCDPFRLCGELSVNIFKSPLPSSVSGFYYNVDGRSVIIVNEALKPPKDSFVAAHELGHALLHPNTNSFFMKTKPPLKPDGLNGRPTILPPVCCFANGRSRPNFPICPSTRCPR